MSDPHATRAREMTIVQITCEAESEVELPIAVIFFDGKTWKLRTVQPPKPDMMHDLKNGLDALVEAFSENGF